ncbi:MAG: hypothetical protein L0G99_14545 [Propionibacteriales bacterium]|nr:hypothetical protein [Propionibacteriales bacterium]
MTEMLIISSRTRTQRFLDAVRAESIKLWTLPATWLVTLGTVALTGVLSVALAADSGGSTPVDSLDRGVVAITWTQCGFFLLGVIAATSEYVGGQCRTTLVAVPDRVVQRLAATMALLGYGCVAALVTVGVSVTSTLIILGVSADTLDLALAARIGLSVSGCLALMAVLSSALGFLLRKAIPAAAILLLYLLVVSPLLQGQRWYFLPDMAAYTLWFTRATDGAPPTPVAWLTILGWTLALLVPSILVARRRDT